MLDPKLKLAEPVVNPPPTVFELEVLPPVVAFSFTTFVTVALLVSLKVLLLFAVTEFVLDELAPVVLFCVFTVVVLAELPTAILEVLLAFVFTWVVKLASPDCNIPSTVVLLF